LDARRRERVSRIDRFVRRTAALPAHGIRLRTEAKVDGHSPRIAETASRWIRGADDVHHAGIALGGDAETPAS
jgi:hypothetical protein